MFCFFLNSICLWLSQETKSINTLEYATTDKISAVLIRNSIGPNVQKKLKVFLETFRSAQQTVYVCSNRKELNLGCCLKNHENSVILRLRYYLCGGKMVCKIKIRSVKLSNLDTQSLSYTQMELHSFSDNT